MLSFRSFRPTAAPNYEVGLVVTTRLERFAVRAEKLELFYSRNRTPLRPLDRVLGATNLVAPANRAFVHLPVVALLVWSALGLTGVKNRRGLVVIFGSSFRRRNHWSEFCCRSSPRVPRVPLQRGVYTAVTIGRVGLLLRANLRIEVCDRALVTQT